MQKKINRRGFLKVSALSTGGMLIGFNLLTRCNPSAKVPTDLTKLDYTDFNAFIKIAENGAVTIFSPNPEIGQGVKTSMPMLIAEELCVSWDMVLVKQADLDTEHFTQQATVGSSAIRKNWLPLRETGATARQMLVNAAALRWRVSPKACTIQNGVISNAKGNKLGIGEVVNEAALLEVPINVSLKKTSAFSIIGQKIKNVDSSKIVKGEPLFGIDYRYEGMVHASMIRPPFGFTLDSYDAQLAKQIDGVLDVLVFMKNNIAVIAKDTFTAIKAAKLLKPKWKAGRNIPDSDAENVELNKLLAQNNSDEKFQLGDAEKALTEADEIIELDFETPYLPHCTMEPMNFFAHVTDDHVKLAGPIQTPENSAKRVARTLKRNLEDVSLEMTRIGGGFGRRLNGNFAVEAAVISNLIRKPVQLVYSREDDMLGGGYRPAINYKVKGGIKNGELSSFQFRQVGKINAWALGIQYPAGGVQAYSNELIKSKSLVTTGAWRAPQSNTKAFAEQVFLDAVAHKLGKDPVEMHVGLLGKAKKSDTNILKYDPVRMEGVVELVRQKSNWGSPPNGVFQGFAMYFSHNTYVAEVAEVILNKGIPEIKRVVCAVDCGIVVNPMGAENQVVGACIDGIGHAMYGDFSIKNGRATSTNYHQYRLIRMSETPQVECHFVKSDLAPSGLGEPALPPAGPALANAIFAATGVRILKQPFIKNKEVFG